MKGPPPVLVLASASPRRSELLKLVGVSAQVESADVDETPILGESAASLVERLALVKAQTVASRRRSGDGPIIVLGGDTVVVLDGEILGKPVDEADARRMLGLLGGRSHQVVSGVALVEVGGAAASGVEVITVSMRSMDMSDIDWYLGTGEPVGKAGAYAIQGFGSVLVDRIDGNHSGVVGLPLPLTDVLLSSLGHRLRDFAGVNS